jgi:hypothetical protein
MAIVETAIFEEVKQNEQNISPHGLRFGRVAEFSEPVCEFFFGFMDDTPLGFWVRVFVCPPHVDLLVVVQRLLSHRNLPELQSFRVGDQLGWEMME